MVIYQYQYREYIRVVTHWLAGEDRSLGNSLHDEGVIFLKIGGKSVKTSACLHSLTSTYSDEEPLEIGRHREISLDGWRLRLAIS